MALTDNIIAYYKHDESSGNLADELGSFELTNNGTTGFVAGKINNAADYGASNSTKSFTSTATAGINGGAITLAGWVNITTAPSDSSTAERKHFLSEQDGSNNVAYQFMYRMVSSTLTVSCNRQRNGTADNFLNVSQTLTTGTYFHLAYTHNGTNGTIYLDASIIAGPTAQTGTGSAGFTDAIAIGKSVQSGIDGFMEGKTDEWGMWSRALSGAEITTLYNSGTGLSYPFGEGAFTPKVIIY